MVDHLQDRRPPAGGYIGDLVLPDLPPGAEALAARTLQRLYMRRWIVVLSTCVIAIFVGLYKLPVLPAALGLVVFTAGAALLPREGIMRPVELNLSTSQRLLASRILDGIIEGLPAPAILLTRQGRVDRFNTLAKDFLPSLKTGEHISGFIRDPGVLDAVADVSATSRLKQIVPYEQRVPIERHMEATISWIGVETRDLSDQSPAILLHLRDLTEQERLDRLRTDFVANASHELRTPLASMVGFIETLQGAARNDPIARERFLDIMGRQAQRMSRLIDNLLSLSRIEMRLHLKPQSRVDLNEVSRHVLATLGPAAEKSRIAVHFAPYRGGAWVLGDRDELVQVVSNLVENATKYGREGGNLWVTIEKPKGDPSNRISLTVRDDGEGIAEKHVPRLTERFYRANDAGGEKSGTGLGLAIVKHVVTRHRGELLISSELGKGSAFTIVLNEAPPAA